MYDGMAGALKTTALLQETQKIGNLSHADVHNG